MGQVESLEFYELASQYQAVVRLVADKMVIVAAVVVVEGITIERSGSLRERMMSLVRHQVSNIMCLFSQHQMAL